LQSKVFKSLSFQYSTTLFVRKLYQLQISISESRLKSAKSKIVYLGSQKYFLIHQLRS